MRLSEMFKCLFLVCGFLVSLQISAFAAPKIQFFHTPVNELKQGELLELSANMPRPGPVVKVVVHLRFTGKKGYIELSMPLLNDDYYELRIPSKKVKPPFVYYYILGKDRKGNVYPLFGSPNKPHKIKVLSFRQRGGLGEELSVFGAEVQIYSASRRKQKITESPFAITVLSGNQLRATGSVSIATMLRQVPGMDTMFISRADPNLSLRGFNREGANKLLTLLDGRSVYIDLFGITFWEALPISILEIDRIEVIRGPGSALYGAGAFSGVVNIFTVPSWKLKGFRYLVQSGPHGTYATLVGGNKKGQISYRASTTYNRQSSFEDPEKDGLESVKGHGLWTYTFQKDHYLQFSGGFSRDRAAQIQTLIGSFNVRATQGFAKGNFRWGNFQLQTFWSVIDVDLTLNFPIPESIEAPVGGQTIKVDIRNDLNAIGIRQLGPERITFQNHTIDLEPQYSVEFWDGRDRLVVGGNFRVNLSNSAQLKAKESTQIQFSVFAQNELKPVSQFIIALGARLDIRSVQAEEIPDFPTYINASPHGSILFKPHPDHTLRVTSGLSFRAPTFFESALQVELIPKGPIKGTKTDVEALSFKGNPKLEPEQMLSLEFGYSGRLFKRVLINLDVFYQRVTNLILFQGDVGGLFNHLNVRLGFASPPDKQKDLFSFTNDISAIAYGGELAMRFLITKWLQGYVNYSFQRIRFLEIKNTDLDKICQSGQKCPPFIEDDSPPHKVNFGFQVQSGAFRFHFAGHYVSESTRINFFTRIPRSVVKVVTEDKELKDITQAEAYSKIPSYFLVNTNFSYALWNGKVEIGIAIFNLLGLLTGGSGALSKDGFTRDNNGKVTGIQEGFHTQYPRVNLFGVTNGGELIGGRIFGFIRGEM